MQGPRGNEHVARDAAELRRIATSSRNVRGMRSLLMGHIESQETKRDSFRTMVGAILRAVTWGCGNGRQMEPWEGFSRKVVLCKAVRTVLEFLMFSRLGTTNTASFFDLCLTSDKVGSCQLCYSRG